MIDDLFVILLLSLVHQRQNSIVPMLVAVGLT